MPGSDNGVEEGPAETVKVTVTDHYGAAHIQVEYRDGTGFGFEDVMVTGEHEVELWKLLTERVFGRIATARGLA